jgi:hypothetical protein
MRILFLVPVLFLSCPAFADEASAGRKLEGCISAEAEGNSGAVYSSLDGGKSALALLNKCKPQWGEFAHECDAAGRTNQACAIGAMLLVNTALKQLGR